MPVTFTRQRIRLELDAAKKEVIAIDRLTGQPPRHWRGNDLRVEIGAFSGLNGALPASEDQVIDVVASGFQSLTVEVKATAAGETNLMAKTTTTIGAMTYTAWLAGTDEHAYVDFSAAEANIAAGTYHLAVSIITTAGKALTLGCASFVVEDDGAGLTAGDPEENPGAGLSLATADARYLTQRARIDLSNGAASVAITFSPSFSTGIPIMSWPTVIKGNPAHPDIWVVSIHSLSDTGFTAVFSAPLPNGDYDLQWIAHQPV